MFPNEPQPRLLEVMSSLYNLIQTKIHSFRVMHHDITVYNLFHVCGRLIACVCGGADPVYVGSPRVVSYVDLRLIIG